MKDVVEKLKAKGNLVNYNDIDAVIVRFLEVRSDTVSFFCRKAYNDVNPVSLAAFKEVLKEDLRNALISFINAGHGITPDGVRSYLSLCVKSAATKAASENKRTIHICPGCKYLGRTQSVEYRDKFFICHTCQSDLVSGEDKQRLNMYKTFSVHSKKGYRCLDCDRFIPQSQEGITVVTCPYPDCIYTGKSSELEPMRHPSIKGSADSMESLCLDSPAMGGGQDNSSIMKDLLTDSGARSGSRGERMGQTYALKDSVVSSSMQVKEDIQTQMNILLKTIADQKSALAYRSNDSTLLLKTLMYNAYENIIAANPEEMIAYLVHENRNGGFQHKIFQEFISLLDKSLPFKFVKNGKHFEIKTLLDPSLCIFPGESVFTTEVTNEAIIENKTEELYVGARKGFYCKSYYIGKLLDVKIAATDEDVTKHVKEYTFFRIMLNKGAVPTGTSVRVRHLRVPPHYQMGGMVHLNRIRRNIVDKVFLTLNGKKREPKR